MFETEDKLGFWMENKIINEYPCAQNSLDSVSEAESSLKNLHC